MTSLAYTRTRRSVGEQAVRYGLFAAAAVSIVTTTLIILSLLRETIAFFGDVPLGEFLFGTKWTPLLGGDQQSFGVIPLLTGTLYLTAIGLVVAIPLGLLAAIYLSEYAPAARAQGRQARAGAAGRRADDRLRLLRARLLHARGAARRLRARGQPVQRALGRDHPRPARAADDRVGRRGRADRRPRLAARGRLRARREQAAGLPARRLPGRALRRGRRADPRRLARRRRDRDHPRGRRPGRPPRDRPDGRLPVDGRVHRRHLARRHPDGLDQVRDDLRRRHGAVRR